jgi:hypothetical protein
MHLYSGLPNMFIYDYIVITPLARFFVKNYLENRSTLRAIYKVHVQ